MGLLSLPALIALVVPFGLVLGLAITQPETLPALGTNPVTAIQLGLGFLLGATIVALPVRGLLTRLRRRQHVAIDGGRVRVEEQRLFSRRSWEAPLADFAGVADHIRASLSGSRHEIILVHAESDKSLLLHIAERPGIVRAETVAKLLHLPQIQAGDLYRRGGVIANVNSEPDVLKAA
jgi:hypothetical protein